MDIYNEKVKLKVCIGVQMYRITLRMSAIKRYTKEERNVCIWYIKVYKSVRVQRYRYSKKVWIYKEK